MSASTRPSSSHAGSDKNMRESFYSTSTGFKQSNHTPELPSNKNVLDFGKKEIKILSGIKELMTKEQDQLLEEIEDLKKNLFEEAHSINADRVNAERPPTSKELKEYKNKLEDTYLNAD